MASGLPEGTQLADLSYRDVLELSKRLLLRKYLHELLRACEGNVKRAAQRAAIERESMHRLLRRFDIQPESYRSSG